jgi:dTDP-4-amino-4,6-dideoxygalactose transaminase
MSGAAPDAPIPMVDLRAQYRRIAGDLDRAMRRVVETTGFVGGPECEAFEREFAAYCGVAHACGVASGTDALRVALWAYAVGPGDEVVTVAHTFVATAEAILQNRARPVFVDVDPLSHTMDPARLEEAITPRTKAIVPVHLYGQPADMPAILEIAGRHGIPVLEDAAQAHGATLGGRRAGALGHAACFSFYPGKNLGAYGDAGAVVSDDAVFLGRVRQIAHHGSLAGKYDNRVPGTNSRLDALQAAVLRAKLPHLDSWNAERRERVLAYRDRLADLGRLILPREREDVRSAWHLFVVRVGDRAELQRHLAARGISSAVHYPKPLHLQPAMASAVVPTAGLPVSEQLAAEVLSLPLYPELSLAQVERVADETRAFCSRRG